MSRKSDAYFDGMGNTQERLKNAWDDYADTWSLLVDSGADVFSELFFIPAFLEFSFGCTEHKVLDLGCGEGRFSRHLAKRGKEVTGIDFSNQMIGIAREKEKRLSLGIEYLVDDMTSLHGFKMSTFGAAFSVMSLMDVPRIQSAASAIARVVKKHGDLWIITLHPCFQTRRPGTDHKNWNTTSMGEKIGRITYDYFGPHVRDFHWRLSQLPEDDAQKIYLGPRVFHSLSDYMNGLIDGGFEILSISEPAPGPELVRRVEDLRPWAKHAALALMIHCRRR